MQLPEIVLTAYAPEDEAVLLLWWEDEEVLHYVGELAKQLRDVELGTETSPGRRIARPTLRWMARDPYTGTAVGYVSVQVTGQSGPDGKLSPVGPPYHGGVNIVVDPQRQCGGIGTAMLLALLEQSLLADVAMLAGSVDARNAGSLGMLRKLGVTAVTTEKRRNGKTFHSFTIPGPATRQN
ncbi:GNAT family N-acetyltransferase [Nocardia beijingensis]